MDSGRQLIRWALPGWIVFMFLIMFIFIDMVFHGQTQSMYLDILKKMSNQVIPLGVASIPLGFIIYQLYHWAYWFIPIPSFSRFAIADPGDRGLTILSGVKDSVDFRRIFGYSLSITPPSALKKWFILYYKDATVMENYRKNWHLSDSAWYLALSDGRYKDTLEYLEKRNQMLSDIYHSLGACTVSIFLGYFFYIIIFVYIDISIFFISPGIPSSNVLIITILLKVLFLQGISTFINSIIFLLVLGMFKRGRLTSFDALVALKHDVITNALLDRSINQDDHANNEPNNNIQPPSEGK